MSTELNSSHWDRIATVFHRALDVPGTERPGLLEQLCGSDETIRREVEGMLEAHEQSPGLIAERRLVSEDREPIARRQLADDALPSGVRVGAYRVESLIGAGGMGDVYRAERADGLHRQTVAIKVLRPGYRTAEMMRRFRVEREALARLVHPGIAGILDGGMLRDGRPYIVLQFVDGVPVTTYCAINRLGIRDRLALFLSIANVVQFAHAHLVIHRDIKPSNILVERDGTPRLLDFGIAKLLDVDGDATLGASTAPDVRLFTPEYAAPEQFRAEPPSTSIDVYALAVLLFEMLTETRPFAAAGRAAMQLERIILETPAPSPSSVARSRADARELRGDLDRIVRMALRKEPSRRYASIAQFEEDIERYLAGRPVRATANSLRYRLGKFIARNRGLVAGGTALALLIGGFAVTSAVQARRISRERDRAERERVSAEDVLQILTGLFERADPNKHPGGDTLRVTSLLDTAESRVASMAADPPRQTALWRAVARMRMARGEYAHGLALFTRAYEQRRNGFGSDDLEAARIHREMATALAAYGGERAARPLLDSSFHELRRLLGETHDEVRGAMRDLYFATTDSIAARALLTRLVALERSTPSKDPMVIAEQFHGRAMEHLKLEQYRDAVALFRAALDILSRQLPREHSDVRTVQRNLAAVLYLDDQLAPAESLQRASVELERRLNGSPVARGMAHEALALTFFAERRADSAESNEREALRAFRAGAAPEHWRIWSALRNLAFMVAARGRVADALALLDSAIVIANTGRDSSEDVGYLTAQRVPFLLRLDRVSEASQAVELSERRLGASPVVTATHRADVHRYAGMVALAAGDPRLAAERFARAVALVESPEKTEAPGLNSCLLGVSFARLGRVAEARPLLEQPCAAYVSRGVPDPLIKGWIDAARRRAP